MKMLKMKMPERIEPGMFAPCGKRLEKVIIPAIIPDCQGCAEIKGKVFWQAVILGNVQIKIGARTEHVHWKRELDIVIRVTKTAKRYGEQQLLDCLEANEKVGVVYHREGISGYSEDLPLKVPEENMPCVTISAGGVTIISQKQEQYETYLKIADMMLYDAKKRERNRVVWSNRAGEQWTEK